MQKMTIKYLQNVTYSLMVDVNSSVMKSKHLKGQISPLKSSNRCVWIQYRY